MFPLADGDVDHDFPQPERQPAGADRRLRLSRKTSYGGLSLDSAQSMEPEDNDFPETHAFQDLCFEDSPSNHEVNVTCDTPNDEDEVSRWNEEEFQNASKRRRNNESPTPEREKPPVRKVSRAEPSVKPSSSCTRSEVRRSRPASVAPIVQIPPQPSPRHRSFAAPAAPGAQMAPQFGSHHRSRSAVAQEQSAPQPSHHRRSRSAPAAAVVQVAPPVRLREDCTYCGEPLNGERYRGRIPMHHSCGKSHRWETTLFKSDEA